MSLTALAVANAKGKPKPYKLFDGGGLHLLVKPSGRRYWRLNYRFGGKYKTLALGTFPTVSLAAARTKRDEAKQLIAEGIDPAVQRRIDKLTRQGEGGNTFKAIAEEWIEKLEREGGRTVGCKVLRGRGAHGRHVSVCHTGTGNLSARMAREGWAVADRAAPRILNFRSEEGMARFLRKNIWSRSFDDPAAWRRTH